jgi:hypothetical protein
MGCLAFQARVEAPPVGGEVFDYAQHARWRVGDAAFQRERTDLIDGANVLRDQPLSKTMQSRQVELIRRLGNNRPFWLAAAALTAMVRCR